MEKLKELIPDFRKKDSYLEASIIHGKRVEIVETHKYLGTLTPTYRVNI